MTPDKEYQSMIPLYENHPALAGLADAADAALALTVSVFRAGGAYAAVRQRRLGGGL